MRAFLITVFVFMFINKANTQNAEIGSWLRDESGLPCFSYTGKIPFSANLPNGKKAQLPEDPWFLLGNYQLTLFTHVSGEYELITGQRAWGRMNQGDKPNSGSNNSTLEIISRQGKPEKTLFLTGVNSLASDPATCSHIFGCGFAKYTYNTSEVTISRTLSVKPSTNPYNGTSAFLLTVRIKNTSGKKLNLAFNESVTANYEMMQQQRKASKDKLVKYANSVFTDTDNRLIRVNIKGVSDDPLLFPSPEAISMYEGFPPSLFLKAISGEVKFSDNKTGDKNKITARYDFALKAKEEKVIELIIGYTFDNEVTSIEQLTRELSQKSVNASTGKEKFISGSAFAGDWLKVLPHFETETNEQLRQELIWDAYVLEAMATYSEPYKETKIPQGTAYDYDWGYHASARDNFQHALPLVYYNPKLAKSALRYMLKRTTPIGEIRLIEMGNGYANHLSFFTTSDQQIFFFMFLSEYLRVTKDYDVLKEEVEYFPVLNQSKATVLEFVEKCFIFLRDEVGTGNHGLIRLLNSDWNDGVYFFVKAPYSEIIGTGESHMNSAMALSILQTLIPELKSAENVSGLSSFKPKIQNIYRSMEKYRASILGAFMNDMGNRTFPRRMYFNGKAYGEDNMFLEPQGYTLQINELSVERKRALYEEMKKRVYSGEKLGAREQQTPEFEHPALEKGSRENGGFWWALNGPVILGVAQFDKTEAMRLLNNMTFANFSRAFPHYWSSYWSASDNVESSLMPGEGLADQTYNYPDMPVYCAHPHAWILYCYYMINQKR